ncbi:MAG: NAD-dependent epimerase/dehydratase family protein [Steroidobacteraceae bacterium]|nr:NAD-dependent epimerase/dehydratase family protein [Deltaproteobacteria bacterium]
MNILILGGAGFIGRHLCAGLTATGHCVTAFDLLPSGGRIDWPDIPGICWHAGDFTNASDIASALKGTDLVIHLVSTTLPKNSNDNPLYDLHGNVGGSLQLLDIMIRQPSPPRIIFLSSGGTVYGIPHLIPIPEDHSTNPLCAYGIGKLAIEKYLALYQRLHGLDYRVLRLANPYGEQQSFRSGQGVIPAFLWKAIHREPFEIWGNGTVVRDYLYIDDVIGAIMATMEYNGPERLFNIGSGSGHSLNDLISLIRELLGKDIPCRYLPARDCDVPINILDIRLALNKLNWFPTVKLQDGMHKMLMHMTHVIGQKNGQI